MLAFFGNLAPSEVLVLAVIAVLVFGKRLPEVAGRGYTQLRRWRQSLDQLRRETGIDRELRNIGHEVDDAARRARIEDDLAEARAAEVKPAEPVEAEPIEPEPIEPEPGEAKAVEAEPDESSAEPEKSPG